MLKRSSDLIRVTPTKRIGQGLTHPVFGCTCRVLFTDLTVTHTHCFFLLLSILEYEEQWEGKKEKDKQKFHGLQ